VNIRKTAEKTISAEKTTAAERTTAAEKTTDAERTTAAVTLYCDNQGAIKTIMSGTSKASTKHIDVRFHNSRHAHASGIINCTYIPTNENTADICTKALAAPRNRFLVDKLGMKDVGLSEEQGGVLEEEQGGVLKTTLKKVKFGWFLAGSRELSKREECCYFERQH
jgi:glutamate formiminotransferase